MTAATDALREAHEALTAATPGEQTLAAAGVVQRAVFAAAGPRPQILAFTGAPGAGKDTASAMAAVWAYEHGIEADRRAFADLPRELLAAALGILPAELDGLKRVGDELGVGFSVGRGMERTVREALTDMMARGRILLGADCWTRLVLEQADASDLLVISDLRFEAEATAVRERGGVVVCIRRPGIEVVGDVGDHFEPDVEIENDGTLDDLRGKVEQVLRAQAGRPPVPS
jgi:hypothetical protein